MGMKDQSDGRSGPGTGAESPFETAFRTGENDFGHCTCASLERFRAGWNSRRLEKRGSKKILERSDLVELALGGKSGAAPAHMPLYIGLRARRAI
jgi:hypothetical protein